MNRGTGDCMGSASTRRSLRRCTAARGMLCTATAAPTGMRSTAATASGMTATTSTPIPGRMTAAIAAAGSDPGSATEAAREQVSRTER